VPPPASVFAAPPELREEPPLELGVVPPLGAGDFAPPVDCCGGLAGAVGVRAAGVVVAGVVAAGVVVTGVAGALEAAGAEALPTAGDAVAAA
jgi:hypothetical protein